MEARMAHLSVQVSCVYMYVCAAQGMREQWWTGGRWDVWGAHFPRRDLLPVSLLRVVDANRWDRADRDERRWCGAVGH